MDFVLGLQSPLSYVLHHGRWPHGSDWRRAATLDTDVLEERCRCGAAGVRALVTIGVTRVLATG